MAGSRNMRLEAARGLAAVAVFFGHFLGAFAQNDLALWFDPEANPIFSHFFWLINGQAAVTLFFVLSGYVLCIQPLTTQQPAHIAASALRRWPRLVPVALATCFISYVIHLNDLFFFEQARLISGTSWHGDWDISAHDPGWLDMLWQGSVGVFFTKTNYLNTNLWTMPKEIIGSYFVYASAAAWLLLKCTRAHFAVLALMILIGLNKTLLPFLAGLLLALRPPATAPTRWWVDMVVLVFAAHMLSYRPDLATGPFSWPLNLAELTGLSSTYTRVLIHTTGSLVLIHWILRRPAVDLLDHPVSRYLGRLSYSLYAIHTIIILSFSSYLFAFTNWGLTVNLILTSLLVLALSLPLTWLDERWVAQLKFSRNLRKAAPALSQES